jgi:hypothetical protein
MFRISKGTNTVIDVAQVDEIEPAVKASKPGRYHVDQIERDLLPAVARKQLQGRQGTP